jgi:hypothetical protein
MSIVSPAGVVRTVALPWAGPPSADISRMVVKGAGVLVRNELNVATPAMMTAAAAAAAISSL